MHDQHAAHLRSPGEHRRHFRRASIGASRLTCTTPASMLGTFPPSRACSEGLTGRLMPKTVRFVREGGQGEPAPQHGVARHHGWSDRVRDDRESLVPDRRRPGQGLRRGEQILQVPDREHPHAAESGVGRELRRPGRIGEPSARVNCDDRAQSGRRPRRRERRAPLLESLERRAEWRRYLGSRESQSRTAAKPRSAFPPSPTIWPNPISFGPAQFITARHSAADCDTRERSPLGGA